MIAVDRWTPSDGIALEPNALAAATETTRNRILTAGPGAGKTEMLAQRADFLLRTGTCRYPRRILAISFKKDAARNLKDRVRTRCGPILAARFDSFTFHAFAKRLIDRFRPVLTGRDALDPDYEIAVRRVQNVSITFKDMVPLAVQIVRASPVARLVVRQTYGHVFLDEFQDCTAEQYELVDICFAGTEAVVTAVGDTKQTIMGFAGAMEGVFGTFVDSFGAEAAGLYQNFRAAPVLRRMQNEMVRVMEPDAALTDEDIVGDGGGVSRLDFDTDVEEAEGIAGIVLERVAAGVPHSEIAVLVSRQLNLYCGSLADALTAAGIPFRDEEQVQDISTEPVVRLILDFLLVVGAERQPQAYRRLLDVVVHGHGADEEQESRRRWRWDAFIREIRGRIGAGTVLLTSAADLATLTTSLIETVGRDRLVALAPDYAFGGRLDGLVSDTLARVRGLLEECADVADALSGFSVDKAVRIMSVHKSKGLEFDTVIVLGVEEETFWGKPDEQRSVFFVGISRAKRQLYLTVAGRRAWPADARRWDERRTPHEEYLSYIPAG